MDWTTCLVNGDVATLQCVPIVFQNFVNSALLFAGAVALAFVIVAWIKIINSGGDPKQVASGKGTFTWALIGLILILFAFLIVNTLSFITGVSCIKLFGFTNCS